MKNGIMLIPCARIGGAGGDERRTSTPASVMPSSRIWPSLRLAVIQERSLIDRLVRLALVRVDAELPEQALPCRTSAPRRA